MKANLELTEAELYELGRLYKESNSSRVRERSHAVLLYAKGYTYTEISDVLIGHKISTISSWIYNFKTYSIKGLYDTQRASNPRASFTPEDKKN